MRYYSSCKQQADVAERYTRLSQKQVPQGLRVRISPSAFLRNNERLKWLPKRLETFSFLATNPFDSKTDSKTY